MLQSPNINKMVTGNITLKHRSFLASYTGPKTVQEINDWRPNKYIALCVFTYFELTKGQTEIVQVLEWVHTGTN